MAGTGLQENKDPQKAVLQDTRAVGHSKIICNNLFPTSPVMVTAAYSHPFPLFLTDPSSAVAFPQILGFEMTELIRDKVQGRAS